MSEVIARIRAMLDDLTPRERMALQVVGLAVALFLVFVAVIRPIQAGAARATERVARAEQELSLMQRLRVQYDEIAGRLSAVENRIARGPKGNIFTTLESLAKNSAVKIESLEPQASPAGDDYREEKVQVVLKNVTLKQLTQYLDQIERAPQLLSIKALRIRTRADKSGLLDVTFTVSAFEPV